MLDLSILFAWPIIGSLLAGGMSFILLVYMRLYREKPGVRWFIAAFAIQTVWCTSFGISLMIWHQPLRVGFEILNWIGIIWIGIAFLGFALEYTGRSAVIRGPLFKGLVVISILATIAVFTNHVHGLVWSELRPEPVLDVVTFRYNFGPLAYGIVGLTTVSVATAVFLLIDTLLSYGSLFMKETAAVALSPLIPGLALLAWIGEVGPYPALNLTPILFIPHVILDAYAFGRAEMFEQYPATIRAAERNVIDNLADPVLIITPEKDLIRCNEPAAKLLEETEGGDRKIPIDDMPHCELAQAIEADRSMDPISIGSGINQRIFTASISPLTGSEGPKVGYTMILSEITEQEHQRQKLEVLNRILRHNLRNDAMVAHGYAQHLVDRLEDESMVEIAESIEKSAGALATLGSKAGTVEKLLEPSEPEEVKLDEILEEICSNLRVEHPSATIEVNIRAHATIHAPRAAVSALIENAIENAVIHQTDETKLVSVRLEVTENSDTQGQMAIVVIEDNGPGLPRHELETIEKGGENSLEHGSGLGLWLMKWTAAASEADVSFDTTDGVGTKVTIRFIL